MIIMMLIIITMRNHGFIDVPSDWTTANVDDSSSIQQNHINETKVHLNRYWKTVFTSNFSNFQSEYYWWSHDNSNKVVHLVQDN